MGWVFRTRYSVCILFLQDQCHLLETNANTVGEPEPAETAKVLEEALQQNASFALAQASAITAKGLVVPLRKAFLNG